MLRKLIIMSISFELFKVQNMWKSKFTWIPCYFYLIFASWLIKNLVPDDNSANHFFWWNELRPLAVLFRAGSIRGGVLVSHQPPGALHHTTGAGGGHGSCARSYCSSVSAKLNLEGHRHVLVLDWAHRDWTQRGLLRSASLTLERRRLLGGFLELPAEGQCLGHTEASSRVLHALQVLLVQFELPSVDKVEEQLQAVAGALVEAVFHARRRGHVWILEQLTKTSQDVAVGQVGYPTTKVQHGITESPLDPLLVQGGQHVLCMAFLRSRHPSFSTAVAAGTAGWNRRKGCFLTIRDSFVFYRQKYISFSNKGLH